SNRCSYVGASVTVVITVIPSPVLTASQSTLFPYTTLFRSKVTLTPGGSPVGTTYTWPLPTMSNASVQGSIGTAVPEASALTITNNVVNTSESQITATYAITPTNGTCAGAPVNVVITVNPAP